MTQRLLSPFERICRFENSGFSLYVESLFNEHSHIWAENLDEVQRVRLDQIRRNLIEWQLIDSCYGEGSALDLEHPLVKSMFDDNLYLRSKYARHIDNAKRYRALANRQG